MNTTNIEIMTAELHKAFKLINKEYFDNKIPLPAITIQSSGNRKLAMGWCTTKEVWRDKDNTTKMYEINLSAEYIDVSFIETMDTLMHEMVHLYNIVHGIKDVSRGGTYHNKKFLERALKSGFIHPEPKPHPKYGYSFIKLSPVTIAVLNELPIDKDVFCISRKTYGEMQAISGDHNDTDNMTKASKSKKTHRWVCPSCDLIVRSTKPDINVLCGDCREQLVNVELDE